MKVNTGSGQFRVTHGLSKHELYPTWHNMIARCTDPARPDYQRYGGRGIGVCARWVGPDGLASFIADVGQRPGPGHSLDRIDNDGNYEPGNVRWATRQEQVSNRRAFSAEARSNIAKSAKARASTPGGQAQIAAARKSRWERARQCA